MNSPRIEKNIMNRTLALWVALLAIPPLYAAPDFTRGDMPGNSHDWTLGATGARGWIHTAAGHSRDARQILITEVAASSPADGVLAKGDVILGVEGKPFESDARVSFAKAVAAVESEKGGGKLKLLRWRNGNARDVELTLQVFGAPSETSPYSCSRTNRIFELGCASLAKRMADEKNYTKRLDPIPRSLNALALLASGNKEYLPLVKREATWAANFRTDGYLSWYYGYLMMFVAEYSMVTGDESVVPGLTRLALETARGQSGVGTWGHRFAIPSGNLGGYGCMNSPGLALTIGMVLSREAGVKHVDLDRAIAKSTGFLRWYIYKGAIPYGDHQPYFAHEDNGKCAAASVLFDLVGDREAAEFFAKMTAAAYSERERGHTGNYFNMLWALQGVARCGPVTASAYLREHSWYYNLARGWDARFLYQGSPVGEEEHNQYTGWDCSGSYLLDFALPRKSLRLTGRKAFIVPPLDAAQTAEVIAAGRDYAYRGDENAYEKRSTEQLLKGLASWSPFVRGRSAAALGKREGDFVPALLEMLAGPDRDARYGAIEGFGQLGPRADAAAPQLRAALTNSDPWIQCLAARSLAELGPQARKASVSDLLAMTVRDNAADPRRRAAVSASIALFSPFPGERGPKSILSESLEGVDRTKLYPAIQSLLSNEDSVVRGSVRKVFPKLEDEDLIVLLPDIVKAVERLAPSNEMFGDGIRLGGLDLLSRLQIREGIPLCVSLIEPERWGATNRLSACLDYLPRYGKHAQAMLPQLKEIRNHYAARKREDTTKQLKLVDDAMAKISASTVVPTLVSVAEFKARPKPGK